MRKAAFGKRMAKHLRECERALASGKMRPLQKAVLAAFAACENAAEMWQLASLSPLSEAAYEGGAFPPKLIDALMKRARASADAEAATIVALATRITAFDAGKVALIDDGVAGLDKDVAAALEKHRDYLREGVGADHEAARAACMHALAGCRNAGFVDAELLAGALENETAADPLASAAIGVGAIVRRLKAAQRKKLARKLDPLWDAARGHKSTAVAVSVAAGRALSAGRVEEADVGVLAKALSKPKALPACWGWRGPGGNETTAHLAVRVLSWADVDGPGRERCVRPLASVPKGKRHRLWDDALVRVALGDVAKLPKAGVSSADLDEASRIALRSLAKKAGEGSSAWLRAFGLHLRDDIAPFLAGRGGLWQPLAVNVDHETQRWHLAKIWREFFDNNVTVEAAAQAVGEQLDTRDALEALCHPRRRALVGVSRHNEKRDVQLMVAMMEELARKDAKMLTLLRKLVADHWGGWDRQALAIGLLCAHASKGETPPARDHELLGRGLAFVPRRSAVDRLLKRLSRADRQAIAARIAAVKNQ